jgi:hypothetical protein
LAKQITKRNIDTPNAFEVGIITLGPGGRQLRLYYIGPSEQWAVTPSLYKTLSIRAALYPGSDWLHFSPRCSPLPLLRRERQRGEPQSAQKAASAMRIEEVQSASKKQRIATHTHIKALGLDVAALTSPLARKGGEGFSRVLAPGVFA